jgi:surface antigen
MTRFYGKVGYVHSVDRQNGVWSDEATERKLYGDVVKNSRGLILAGDLNADLTSSNSISVVADNYAMENIFAIRYVEWEGALWTVTNVEEQRPRLLLRLGGVYNGATPAGAPSAPQGDGG